MKQENNFCKVFFKIIKQPFFYYLV